MRCGKRVLVLGVLALAAALPGDAADACGPFFPNSVLDDGDHALTTLPALEFAREIARIPRPNIAEASLPHVADTDTGAAEARDLAVALRARGDSATAVARRLDEVARFRARIATLERAELPMASEPAPGPASHPGAPPETAPAPRHARAPGAVPAPPSPGTSADAAPDAPPFPVPPAGLPEEFDLYLRGASAWRAGHDRAARDAWTRVLRLPPERRRSCDLRARYMLGRSLVDTSPAEAVAHLASVRKLVADGAADPLGLARASAGWEARAAFRRRDPVRALTLYHALGDTNSTLVVLRSALADDAMRSSVIRDPLARRLGTALVVSRGGPRQVEGIDANDALVGRWLAAAESAGAAAVEDADRLAWIAYSAGEFDMAARWAARAAARSPVLAWVEAKLLLRAGRLAEASGRLAEAARGFPRDEVWGDAQHDWDEFDPWGVAPARRLLAEHGAIELRRGDFVAALDAFLRSGAWRDAARVAERVLTIEELARFIAERMPVKDAPERLRPWWNADIPTAALHSLLARRLARAGRWKEAMPHFPDDVRRQAEIFVANLAQGRGRQVRADIRAESLRVAARTLRAHGIDLIGTEAGPDWAIWGGDYDLGEDAAGTRARDGAMHPDEQARYDASAVRNARRWHYRYVAMDVAWEAAALMSDQDDATAAWLCEAGRWVAAHDPKSADRFYKALIRRCGATRLGIEAVKRKWFPRWGDRVK